MADEEDNGDTAAQPSGAIEFLIQRWEISYVYSCYLNQDIPNLLEAGKQLLRHHFGQIIMLPDGTVSWRGVKDVETKQLSEEDTIGAARTQIVFPQGLPLDLRPPVFTPAIQRSASP